MLYSKLSLFPVVLCFLPSLVSAGFYEAPVKNVNAKELKKVLASNTVAMVAFVAPWCGHCKTLAPEFKKAASSLDPLIPFYAVDCDDDQNKPLCGSYGVQGFPTVKAFPRGAASPPRDYQGERKSGAIVQYAAGLVPESGVTKLKSPAKGGVSKEDGMTEVITFLTKNPSNPHVLLLHPKSSSIPLLWKTLAARFTSITFGFLRDADNAVRPALGFEGDAEKARIGIWRNDAAALDPEEAAKMEQYDGQMKFEPLLKFLSEITGVSPSSSESASTPKAVPSGPPAPNASQLKKSEERAKQELLWAEEEKRENERRAKREAKRKAREAEEEREAAELAAEEAAAKLEEIKEEEVSGATMTEEPAPEAVAEVPVVEEKQEQAEAAPTQEEERKRDEL